MNNFTRCAVARVFAPISDFANEKTLTNGERDSAGRRVRRKAPRKLGGLQLTGDDCRSRLMPNVRSAKTMAFESS